MIKASEMVRLLTEAMAKNPTVASISVDGQTLTYNRAQALKELEYWKREAARESGRRKLFKGVDIGSAF